MNYFKVTQSCFKCKSLLFPLDYTGDYGSTAWLANIFKDLWDDSKLGSVPITWAVNPNLYHRFSLLHTYLYNTRTANDLWIERNRYYDNKFNLKHSGFIINGLAGPLTNSSNLMYTKFSPLGLTCSKGYSTLRETALISGTRVPIFTQIDIVRPTEVQKILSMYVPNTVRFVVCRGTLRSASEYANDTAT